MWGSERPLVTSKVWALATKQSCISEKEKAVSKADLSGSSGFQLGHVGLKTYISHPNGDV